MENDTRNDFRQVDSASTLRAIEKLQNDRCYRDTRGLFFVEGVRNFVAAVDHRFKIHTLFYCEKLLTNPLARKLVRRLKRAGVPFTRVSPEEFRKVSKTERASGVGAILCQRIHQLERITVRNGQGWTAISHARSPGNFGSLIRTSAATGAAGFFLLGDSIDPYDPTVVRATMGALFRQVLVRTSVEELRRWAELHSIQVIGASPDGTVDYDQV